MDWETIEGIFSVNRMRVQVATKQIIADRDRWRDIAGELAGWLKTIKGCYDDHCDLNTHILIAGWDVEIAAALARFDAEDRE